MQAVERPEENFRKRNFATSDSLLSCLQLQLASSLQLAAYSLHLPDCIPQFSPSSLHPPGCSLPPACSLQLAPSLHAPSLQVAAFSLHPPGCSLQLAPSFQLAANSLHPPSYTFQLAASSSHLQPSLDRKHPTYGFTLWTTIHSFLGAVIFSTCRLLCLIYCG